MISSAPTPTAVSLLSNASNTSGAALPFNEPSTPFANGTGDQIAFVDSSLDNVDSLIASLENATVYLIDNQEGVSYITEVLAQYRNAGADIGSVHIFAHGQAGALQLGTTTLNADSLNGHAEALATWGRSQTNDILLYGCNVAEGITGNAFLDQFAALTGADIQASNDITGSAALGGDWALEVSKGTIETTLVISEKGQASYQGTLALAINGGATATTTVDEGTLQVIDLGVTGAAGGFTEGNGVEYYFFGGQDSYLFDLNADTGVLSFQNAPDFFNPLDFDKDNTYDVQILAIDYSGQQTTQSLAITVQNSDDIPDADALTITSNGGGSAATVTVNSGATQVTDIEVAGIRGGFSEGNGVEYYFFGGQDSYLFNLDVNTGNLTFQNAPNAQTPIDANGDNIYEVGILAIDYTGQSITQTLAVTVQESPVITSNGGGDIATVTIDEGTTAVTNVEASPANGFSEGNGFTYSLNGGDDAALFNIDPTTGVISFKTAPDFESPGDADGNNVYFANVLVQDPTGAADSQFISVIVSDVTEAGNSPVITSNGGGDSAFIQVAENTSLAVDMSATDADGDTEGNGITYIINDGEDAALFDIDPNTGVISLKSAPDYENPLDSDFNNIYRINVLAFDSTGLADSQFIEVAVTNMVSVYLLGGQSNMAGETSNANDLSGAIANPFPDVQIWQPGFNSFVDLRPGFNENFGTGQGFGAELGFGHALQAARANGSYDSEEIYLVKYAIGATSLAEDWNIDGTGTIYNNFNSWVNGALNNLEANGIGFEIEAMLWMQGENDAFDATRAANYQTNLTNFIGDVRSRYGADMDFLIGRLHEELPTNFYTEANVVRNTQTAVANANPNNFLIDTDTFAVNPIDGVHFDSLGHLALGEAFANKLIA